MDLADMLSYADIHQLNRIADTYQCSCNGHSKNELIQSILSAISRRDVLEHFIDTISIEDLRLINSLLFDQRNYLSLEELMSRVHQTKFDQDRSENWNPRDVISKFKQRGWLFNGFSHQTKYLFQFPQDLKLRFSDAIARHFYTKLIFADSQPVVYREEQSLISEDIYIFLNFVFNQDIALSADGTIYKRNLQQILELLSVREAMLGKGGWRFGYGRKFKEYPSRFSLIYDYCYFQGYLSEEKQKLEVTETGRIRLKDSSKDELFPIFRFWLKIYKVPIYNLVPILQWISMLTKEWVTQRSLSDILCKLIKPYYYDNAESILEQRIVQMLMHLGVVRVGEDEELGKLVQITKLGSKVLKTMGS